MDPEVLVVFNMTPVGITTAQSSPDDRPRGTVGVAGIESEAASILNIKYK